MLETRNEDLSGKVCLVSGSGNVAQYTVEKLIQLGAKPVTLSDSAGYIYDEAGITREKLAFVMDLKNVRRGRIKEYADKFKGVVYTADERPLDHNPLWNHKARLRLPSATQNEINGKDAANLMSNGVYAGAEGANMPTTLGGRRRSSWRRRFSTARARRPTRAGLRSPAWRWRRTACVFPGRARKSTSGCRRS